MKKLRMLKRILKETKADKILVTYCLSILLVAIVMLLVEKEITNYGDALWYCYEVISTIGFGEFQAVSLVGRCCSFFLTVYSLIVIAIVTGVVTNFYIQLSQLRNRETLESILDKLERLPELERQELEELSERVKMYRNK